MTKQRAALSLLEGGFSARVRLHAGALGGLAGVEEVCLLGSRFLNEQECQTIRDNYLLYRSAYNKLAEKALSEGEARFHTRPKQHMYEHLCLDFTPRNFRYLACYVDEDAIRRVKFAAVACHPKFMSKQVLFRYALKECLKMNGGM